MVFDINGGFLQKEVGGGMTHTMDIISYSSVVTRETLWIALTMTALHDLEVTAVDVLNTYVTPSSREKIWMVLGSEFGDNHCKNIIWSKESGASFRVHLAPYMQELGMILVMLTLTYG